MMRRSQLQRGRRKGMRGDGGVGVKQGPRRKAGLLGKGGDVDCHQSGILHEGAGEGVLGEVDYLVFAQTWWGWEGS